MFLHEQRIVDRHFGEPSHPAAQLYAIEFRAMDFLERAYEERAGSVYGIKGSFLFTTLHTHPRFKALLRKMNLA